MASDPIRQETVLFSPQDPGRVFPGKKMPGHYGAVTRTVQNLVIARIDTERGLLLVRGAVPGHDEGHVVITAAVKAPAKA